MTDPTRAGGFRGSVLWAFYVPSKNCPRGGDMKITHKPFALLCMLTTASCTSGVVLTREATLTDAMKSVATFDEDIQVANIAAMRSQDVIALAGKQKADTAFPDLFCSIRCSRTIQLTGIVSDRAKRLDKYAKEPDAGLANTAAALRKELALYKELVNLKDRDPKKTPLDAPGGKDETLRHDLCVVTVANDLTAPAP